MTDKDHLIWSDYHIDYEDWREYLEQEYPNLTEAQRYDMMYQINAGYLDDERQNLNICLSQPILVIADIGRWNGRFSGYKEISSGNIRDCLYANHDYATWYVNQLGDLWCDDVHHDATNHYLYRVFKDTATPEQRDSLKNKIYEGTATRADITRLTRRLGDDIARVYGWDLHHRSKSAKERS